jgi:nucleotide-binding universal stress UspA family protein
MKKILVGTDGSPSSDRAVDAAAELARASGAELVIVTIAEPPSPELIEALGAVEHVARGDVAEIVSGNVLFCASERARRAGVQNIVVHSELGDPTAAILQAAKDRQVDAVVVGRRGRGRLSGLLLGSVSQKLVTLAPCMVVVVP